MSLLKWFSHFGPIPTIIGGWASIYVHLSGRDLDQAILELHGISMENEKKERFERRICPRCDTENSLTAKFCLKCGFVLDKKTGRSLKSGKV